MSQTDARVARLYQLPLADFTAARNQLARELGGADGKAVKQLAKPSATAWAINQLHWQASEEFQALRDAGAALLAAQIAALDGRHADLRAAHLAHRRAVASALSRTVALASLGGLIANRDQLAQALEALSLATELPEPAGRMTQAIGATGFGALGGMAFGLAVPGRSDAPPPDAVGRPLAPQYGPSRSEDAANGEGAEAVRARKAARAEAARERARAKAEAEWRAALATAEAAVREAEATLGRAEAALADAEERRVRADHACTLARIALADAKVAVRTIKETRVPAS